MQYCSMQVDPLLKEKNYMVATHQEEKNTLTGKYYVKTFLTTHSMCK